MGHACDLAKLVFAEGGVGDDCSQGGVSCELVLHHLDAPLHQVLRAPESIFVFAEKARDLPAGLPVVDIAQSVEGDQGADPEWADLDGIASDSGLHAGLHTAELTDGRPASCAEVAVSVVGLLKGQPCRFPSHDSVRPGPGVGHRQIEEVGLGDQGHLRDGHVEAYPLFLQVFHDSVRCPQPESAAAGKDDRVDLLGCRQRVQKLAVSGCRTSAPHIQSRSHAVLGDDHGAAGAGPGVFCLADPDGRDLCDWNLSHYITPLCLRPPIRRTGLCNPCLRRLWSALHRKPPRPALRWQCPPRGLRSPLLLRPAPPGLS